jgi:hypothetical protein
VFSINRTGFVVLTVVLAGILGLSSGPVTSNLGSWIGPASAYAKEAKPKKRRSLFSILFGRSKSKKKKAVGKKKRRGRRKSASSAKRSPPAIKAVEKNADAKVILIVGDFFASGLADGLSSALSQVATLRVVNKSKGLSGFVRTDIVDWPAVLPALIEETKPSYIVAMLGSNDRQLINQNGNRLKKLTPEWFEAYAGRVEKLGTAMKASRLPYSWIGLPPVRFKNMNKDFLAFNELYGKAAGARPGRFIDVWDGFSDAEGNYSRSGPDVNGQIVLLRAKDGINLTRAGKRRLAFYVESIMFKMFGGDGTGSEGLAGSGFDFDSQSLESPLYDPVMTRKTFVVQLNDPSADGGDVLAGDMLALSADGAQTLLVPVNAESPPAPYRYGRVDDFTWPPQDAVAPAPAAEIARTGPNGAGTSGVHP